jgi:hypothetical protein
MSEPPERDVLHISAERVESMDEDDLLALADKLGLHTSRDEETLRAMILREASG